MGIYDGLSPSNLIDPWEPDDRSVKLARRKSDLRRFANWLASRDRYTQNPRHSTQITEEDKVFLRLQGIDPS